MYAELADDENDSDSKNNDSNNSDSDSNGESDHDNDDTVEGMGSKLATLKQKWVDYAKAQRALTGPYIEQLTRDLKGKFEKATSEQFSDTCHTMRLTSSAVQLLLLYVQKQTTRCLLSALSLLLLQLNMIRTSSGMHVSMMSATATKQRSVVINTDL
jgi:hypothetical protein